MEKASLKQIYNEFYDKLVDAVSDKEAYGSLIPHLLSTGLIPEDKKALLSSSQASGSFFLKHLGIEEKPQVLKKLMLKMIEVKQFQALAREMFTRLAELKQGKYVCTCHFHDCVYNYYLCIKLL